MELLDLIETQMVANRLPLVGVTLAAVPHANTPLVLTLHWHGFVEIRLAETADANPVAYQSVPSSALQVNKRWDHFDDIDLETMETAWELGAWDLQRIEARPPLRMGASVQDSIECMTAFGTPHHLVEGNTPIVAEVPDADDLIEAASNSGYIQWTFRPVRGGLWTEVADDMTLESGGYRNPACPYMSEPVEPGQGRKIVYRFGRGAHLSH